jgi:cytochrome c oxidase accessory protein FixG
MNGPSNPSAAAAESELLYEVRRKIQPRAVSGLFAGWRWALVWGTQLLFYGLPWLTWNDRPAILFDLLTRRFYLFGLVLYPQDFIYLTGLLVISAMALFLFTTVAGRLWCGYACPQTVYTELFLWIERRVEGDRAARLRLDRAGPSARKLGLRSLKHLRWIALALWTGLSFVAYFTPIRVLLGEVADLALGPWETFWILFYGLATYGNAGFMREQVCKYMCPYARFQSSMFDRDTLIITYDEARGEPRGSRSRKADPAALGLGSCIDCGLCVEVCPTGIDIRNGLQYECIGCAACIDTCDQIMDKMGYARGLIRYTTQNALANGWSRARMIRRALRPRVLVYGTILLTVTVALFTHVVMRTPLKLDVIRDRGSLGREVEDGEIENVFRLHVINTAEIGRRYQLSVSGIASARIASTPQIEVPAAQELVVPVRVLITGGAAAPGSSPLVFRLEALDDPSVTVREKSVFYVPR